jgi:hypothetical protein
MSVTGNATDLHSRKGLSPFAAQVKDAGLRANSPRFQYATMVIWVKS